jgi:FixJ family two-component response regulator
MGSVATVHLVDDDAGFLTATCRLLCGAGLSVAAFASAAELLSRVSVETRGCVVADLSMPGLSGLELQALLQDRGILMPVVFLSACGDVPSSVNAMKGGAVDFLEKLAPKERLLSAIERALAQDLQRHAAEVALAERRRRFSALTQREREVLELVVRGKMNKQIAAELGIHERTVKLHRTAITTKLGVHAVAQLAVLASEARLGELSRPPQSAS